VPNLLAFALDIPLTNQTLFETVSRQIAQT